MNGELGREWDGFVTLFNMTSVAADMVTFSQAGWLQEHQASGPLPGFWRSLESRLDGLRRSSHADLRRLPCARPP